MQDGDVAPDEDGYGTGDHAGQRAGRGELAPVEAQQHDRAEGRAEAGPGEADKVKDAGVAVQCQRRGDDCDNEHAGAAQGHFLLGGQLLAGDVVEVLHQGGGAHDQLRGHGGHDGRQHRGQHQAGDERVEEDLAQQQEDGFRVVDLLGRVPGEVDDAHQCRDDRAEGGQGHPADADAAGGLGLAGGAQRHEAHDDVRLAEVAEAPGRGGEDRHGGKEAVGSVEAGEQVQRIGVDGVQLVGEVAEAAHLDDGDDRHGNQGREHQQALGHVGERCAEEPAEERVEQGDADDDEHAREVVPAERGLEELAGGDHAGGDVEGEERQDDQRGGDAQEVAVVLEALLEEARDGDRVLRDLRVGAQSRGHELPVQPRAEGQADRDPGLDQAVEVDGAGQAHEQPAGHVGGAGGQGCHAGLQAAAREHVVVDVVGAFVGEVADGQHRRQVHGNGYQLEGLFRHGGTSWVWSVPGKGCSPGLVALRRSTHWRAQRKRV